MLFPCLVLIALGLRITEQERELAEKRAADERRRRVEETRELLSARLQRIAIVEVDTWLRRESAGVALVARILRDQLELLLDVLNLLDETAAEGVMSTNVFSPQFGEGSQFVTRRQAMFGIRFSF